MVKCCRLGPAYDVFVSGEQSKHDDCVIDFWTMVGLVGDDNKGLQRLLFVWTVYEGRIYRYRNAYDIH